MYYFIIFCSAGDGSSVATNLGGYCSAGLSATIVVRSVGIFSLNDPENIVVSQF